MKIWNSQVCTIGWVVRNFSVQCLKVVIVWAAVWGHEQLCKKQRPVTVFLPILCKLLLTVHFTAHWNTMLLWLWSHIYTYSQIMLTDRALGIPKHHQHKPSSWRPWSEFLGNRRNCVVTACSVICSWVQNDESRSYHLWWCNSRSSHLWFDNVPSDRNWCPYKSTYALLPIACALILHKHCGTQGCCTLLNTLAPG
jgi:hypothetical protein